MILPAEFRELAERIRSQHTKLFDKFSVESSIRVLDTVPSNAPYHFIPAPIHNLWKQISGFGGSESFAAFQKVTMLNLMEAFAERADQYKYTEEIILCFNKSYQRIFHSALSDDENSYTTYNDIFLKDLALARQKLFPAGAQVVERDSGISRSLVFRDGVGQFSQFLKMLLCDTRGASPFYQIHTHLSELDDFNAAGWDECYVRIASMLNINDEVKGMFGGSWFYDPALAEVSPRLSYLRERPAKNGAYLFYSGIDINGGALAKSKTRQALYNEGRYVPKSYSLVWPRKQLLAWADSVSQG